MRGNFYELMDYYFSILKEELYVRLKSLSANYKRIKTYPDNEVMKNNYYMELKKYYDTLKIEKKVCRFLIKNDKYLTNANIDRTMHYLSKNAEKDFLYIDDFIDMLDTACDLNLDYKFYVPKNKPRFVSDINEYLNISKGFTIDSVGDFLINEEVYTKNDFKSALSKVKHLSIVKDDIHAVSGVFDKGILFPEVVDVETTLIAIYELVSNALINNRDNINDIEITYGESLPLFYEYLYCGYNKFASCDLKFDHNAYYLFDNYDYEPMSEQIKKLKYILKKKR